MLIIPKQLYTKEITSYIRDLVLDYEAKDFYSLDATEQDVLVGLGLKYLDCELILSSDSNHLLSKYLLSHDRDDEIEFRNSVKDSAREHFALHFDQMIIDEVNNQSDDDLRVAGKRSYQDRVNGEITWL